jgi:U3 small nucleolar RNA-associated protein 11
MSSLRNAVKRVTHKERAQPAARKKFGLLEKHKDYVVRAKDFHKKRDILKTLKKKASDRNPDEFYYKMHNSQVSEKGVHKEIRDGSLSTDKVKQLKTQDYGYIVHKKAVDDKKAERMKKSLHMIGDKAGNKKKKHTIFVDEQKQVECFDPVEHFETTPELYEQGYNRVRKRQVEEMAEKGEVPSALTVKKVLDKRDKAYKELEQRSKRAGKLDKALKKLTEQRNVMGKGDKRKVASKDGGDAVYKWKRRRTK